MKWETDDVITLVIVGAVFGSIPLAVVVGFTARVIQVVMGGC